MIIYNKAGLRVSTLPRRKYEYVDMKKRKVLHKKYVPQGGGGFDIINFATSDAAYLMSKSIITFTMVYCSLNWMYYKDINKKLDEEDIKDIKDIKDKTNKK